MPFTVLGLVSRGGSPACEGRRNPKLLVIARQSGILKASRSCSVPAFAMAATLLGNVFVYGSLLAPEVLTSLLHRVPRCALAVVDG